MEKFNRTWAEINLDNMRYNCTQLKGLVSADTKFMAVVKADAYGHGDVEVALNIQDIVDGFAVSNIMEASRLRSAGIEKSILILGYTPVEKCDALFEMGITQAVVGLEYAQKLSEAAISAGVKVKVHMALDTGMSRIGFWAGDTDTCVNEITKAVCLPGLDASGIFTHFCVADENSENSVRFTELQHTRLMTVLRQLKQKGIEFQCVHCSNSAALIGRKEYDHDMVRAGIVMYGCSPDGGKIDNLDLKPVMSLKSVVSLVKEIPAGETIGYGRKFKAEAPMSVATIAIGYADGYPRCLSNKGYVFVNDCVVPIVGNICMDQLMLDVSYVDVKEGDVVTLFGEGSPISVDNVAAMAGTINYEILCGISRRVERVYIRGGKEIAVVDYTA